MSLHDFRPRTARGLRTIRGAPGLPLWGEVGFAVASVVVFCNLNGIGAMLTQTNRLFSLLLMAGCIIVLLTFRVRFAKALGQPGLLFFAFCLYYVVAGTFTRSLRLQNSPGNVAWDVAAILPSLLIILAFAVAGHYAGTRGLEQLLLRWMFLAACAASLSVLLDLLYPRWSDLLEFRKDFKGRATGFFADPNELGLRAGYTMVLGAALAAPGRPGWYMVALAVAFVAAFFSLSKTAILMYLVLSLALGLALLRGQQKFSKLLGLGFAALLVFGGLSMIESEFLPQTFTQGGEGKRRLGHLSEILLQGRVDDQTTTGRFGQVEEGFAMWTEAPIFGQGLGALVRMPKSGLGPHNTLISFLGESGLIGFGLFLASALCFGWRAWRSSNVTWRIFYGGSAMVMFATILTRHTWLVDRGSNAMLGFCLGLLSVESRSPSPISSHPPALAGGGSRSRRGVAAAHRSFQ